MITKIEGKNPLLSSLNLSLDYLFIIKSAHSWGLLQYRMSFRKAKWNLVKKKKPCDALFACNLFVSCQIVLIFCTEHGNITAVLCAKFQNNLINEMDVMDEKDFTRFEFKRSWGGIYHILKQPLKTAAGSLSYLTLSTVKSNMFWGVMAVEILNQILIYNWSQDDIGENLCINDQEMIQDVWLPVTLD